MTKYQKVEVRNIKKTMRVGFNFKTARKLVRKHFNNLDSWLHLKKVYTISI